MVEVKVRIEFHGTKRELLKLRVCGWSSSWDYLIEIGFGGLQVLVSSKAVHLIRRHGKIVWSRCCRRYKWGRKITNDIVVHHGSREARFFDLNIRRWSEAKGGKCLVAWCIQAFCYDSEATLEAQEHVLCLLLVLLGLEVELLMIFAVHQSLVSRQCCRRWNLLGDLGASVSSTVGDFKDGWVIVWSLNLLCSQTALGISMSAFVIAPESKIQSSIVS